MAFSFSFLLKTLSDMSVHVAAEAELLKQMVFTRWESDPWDTLPLQGVNHLSLRSVCVSKKMGSPSSSVSPGEVTEKHETSNDVTMRAQNQRRK